MRRYIEGARARNGGNGEGNGGPGRGGGGAPRGRGPGNDRGNGDDGDGAPPAGGRGRGRGPASRAPRRPPSPPSNLGGKLYSFRYWRSQDLTRIIPGISPPQARPHSSLRETVSQADPSSRSSSSRLPKCDCGTSVSKKRVVQKSAHEGRQFYVCAQDVCGFFKWIEGEYDQEDRGGTGPAPLVPAKRAIGTDPSVSDVRSIAKISSRKLDTVRIKPYHQRVNVSVKGTRFNVQSQRRGTIKGAYFGVVQKEGMKGVVSLSGMMSLLHLDQDLQFQCRRERLAITTLKPAGTALR